MKIKQNKLMNYCAIPAGVLASAASVSGQTVIFYGENSVTPLDLIDPIVVEFTARGAFHTISNNDGVVFRFTNLYETPYGNYFFRQSDTYVFTPGPDVDGYGFGGFAMSPLGAFSYGAEAGSNNFVSIDFGDDEVFEAVAQFEFGVSADGVSSDGSVSLLAIAFSVDSVLPNVDGSGDLSGIGGSSLSLVDGAAAIAAASVPEPSSLALLALGAAGLISRRQRKAA